MKRVERKNCFETNSSSVHAIVINPKGKIKKPETGVIFFNLGEYGWEFATYDNLSDRASYLWTAIVKYNTSWRDDVDDIYYIKEIKDWVDYITKTVQDEFKGELLVEFEYPKSSSDFYYIDHVEELGPWLDSLRNDPDKLLIYLLGEDSKICTGNDNSDMGVDIGNVPSDCSVYWK